MTASPIHSSHAPDGPQAQPPVAARADGSGAWRWIIWISCGIIDLLLVGGLAWWLWG